METLKALLTTLKERLNNPLILSFIASWLFSNYQIPLVLLFYKQTELVTWECQTYLEIFDYATGRKKSKI